MNLEAIANEILERVGVKKGQIVLDFGCSSGTYTIPAAKIVGKEGKVYALDKDKKAINEVIKKAESEGLKNIERMDTSGELKIYLDDMSIDMILLYDVFHDYYFPSAEDRRKLLDEIHRVLKQDGSLSVWPKHMESRAKDEIEQANFYLENKYSATLIHDNKDIEEGEILNFALLTNSAHNQNF